MWFCLVDLVVTRAGEVKEKKMTKEGKEKKKREELKKNAKEES